MRILFPKCVKVGAPPVALTYNIPLTFVDYPSGTCAGDGAETVIITPYFLSQGRHIQEDLPRLMREAEKLVPGVKCILADPLGMWVLVPRMSAFHM